MEVVNDINFNYLVFKRKLKLLKDMVAHNQKRITSLENRISELELEIAGLEETIKELQDKLEISS